MTDNIMYGGYQYNCDYLKKCIKPCRVKNNKQINPMLVRSVEANEKQEITKSIVSLEKTVKRLENRIENIINEPIKNVSKRYPCLKPMNSTLLQKSKEAMMYSNLTTRVVNVFNRIQQLATITDTLMEVNNIKITARFQPGVVRYNLCVNIKIARQRLNLLNKVTTDIEENPDLFTISI